MSESVHTGAMHCDGRTGRFRTNRGPVWAILMPQHRTVTDSRPNGARKGRVVLSEARRNSYGQWGGLTSAEKHLTHGEQAKRKTERCIP